MANLTVTPREDSGRVLERLFVLADYPPSRTGWARFTKCLVETIQKLRPSVEVLVASPTEEPENTAPRQTRVGYVGVRKPMTVVQAAAAINRIRRFRPEGAYVYFAPVFGGYLSTAIVTLLYVLTLRFMKVHILLHLDSVWTSSNRSLRSRVLKIGQACFVKLLTAFVNRILVFSKSQAAILQELFSVPPEKVMCWHHPLSLPTSQTWSRWKPAERTKPHRSVLFFGLLARYKGIHHLIRAFPSVLQRFPSAKLIIAGDYLNPEDKRDPSAHTYLPELRELSRRLGIEPSIVWLTRFLDDQELDYLICSSDLVVLPYTEMSALAESAALSDCAQRGVPVVVTDTHWFNELVINRVNGLVVPPGDSTSLAAAIVEILSSDDLARKLGEALERTAGDWTWEAIAEKVIHEFEIDHEAVRRSKATPLAGTLLDWALLDFSIFSSVVQRSPLPSHSEPVVKLSLEAIAVALLAIALAGLQGWYPFILSILLVHSILWVTLGHGFCVIVARLRIPLKVDVATALLRELDESANRHQMTVIVYGSLARSAADVWSDVDAFVLSERRRFEAALFARWWQIVFALHAIPMDLYAIDNSKYVQWRWATFRGDESPFLLGLKVNRLLDAFPRREFMRGFPELAGILAKLRAAQSS